MNKGLILEDRQILLPWGARRYHLMGVCRPDRLSQTAGWEELHWYSPQLLNGLKAHHVQIVLYPYGWLDEIWIWLERGDCPDRAHHVYEQASKHLTALFGQPSISQPAQQCENFRQVNAWDWRETRLGLYVRAGELMDDYRYCTVAHIARRPEGCIPAPP
jgi:hypothetical protein